MPGSPDEQHHLALALLGPLPAVEQQRQLLLAADQRRERRAACRASKRPSAAPSPSDARRPRTGAAKPLSARGAEVASSNRPPSRRRVPSAMTTAPGLGQRLQARGEVRRLADHRLLARRALADQVADDDEAGGDPDPGGERLAGRRAQAGHGRGDGEPGPDRALGLVLVRPGPAEVGEHAVAHELGDVALEARDLARDRVLVGAEDLAHLLGVEPRGERGRADQVDEHHRELPPLGLGGRRGRGPARRRPARPSGRRVPRRRAGRRWRRAACAGGRSR